MVAGAALCPSCGKPAGDPVVATEGASQLSPSAGIGYDAVVTLYACGDFDANGLEQSLPGTVNRRKNCSEERTWLWEEALIQERLRLQL